MRIEREIIRQFKAWKDAPDRKPILLKGARQIDQQTGHADISLRGNGCF